MSIFEGYGAFNFNTLEQIHFIKEVSELFFVL